MVKPVKDGSHSGKSFRPPTAFLDSRLLRSPITALVLSKSQSHLISGTASGHIYIHSLPSHQHLRTITSHIGVPITHLSTLLRPPDLVGSVSLRDAANAATSNGSVAPGAWPVREVKQFERMKVLKRDVRHMGDVGILLRPHFDFSELEDLDTLEESHSGYAFNGPVAAAPIGVTAVPAAAEQVIALEAELAAVKAQLHRAHEINQEMWTGVVDKTFERVTGKGVKELERAVDGDVRME